MNCTESAMSVAGNPRVGARRHVGGGESMSQAMESMWEMELGLMPFVLELFSAAIAYVYLLRRKGRFLSRVLLVCLLAALSPTYMMIFLPRENPGMEIVLLLHALFSVAAFGVLIFGIWFCFEVRLREALYCATCAYITEHVVYCLRILLDALTKTDAWDGGSVWYYLLHAAVYLLAYHVVAKRMVQNHHYETRSLHSVGLMVLALFIVYLMSVVSFTHGLGWFHAIYALVCCGFMLLSQRNQVEQLRMQKELHTKEQIWRQNKAQYEMSRETIEIINRKCHDLKHQIQALKGIENIKRQKEVVAGIEESVMIYETIKNTGNAILDTVLTEKGLLCRENHVRLNVMADGRLLDFMDDIDLYTLFGNALDNAVEANLRVAGERYVNLQIREKVGMVLIRMENPYAGEIRMADGRLLTEKADKEEHGFGSRSIRHTAEEYGGLVKIETENQIFVLRIMIPLTSVTT